MEIVFDSSFWILLLAIVWVDILLSGDNAIVIALVARTLPPAQQRQAIIWGSVAAIAMRVTLTIFATRLLELPLLKLAGGLMLIWIGVQLLGSDDGDGEIKAGTTVLGAVKTIVMADLAMSLDNVLGVAATAHAAKPEYRTFLLMFGLSLSIPIMVFGSRLMLRFMERFPIIVTLGAMMLGWIGGEMLAGEPALAHLFSGVPYMGYGLSAACAVLVLLIARVIAWYKSKKSPNEQQNA